MSGVLGEVLLMMAVVFAVNVLLALLAAFVLTPWARILARRQPHEPTGTLNG